MPSNPIAAGQQAALLPIDTACHTLRAAAGAIDGFADGGALLGRFHMNSFSVFPAPSASYPRSTDAHYSPARPVDRQCLEN
jgi:hypothetical protein